MVRKIFGYAHIPQHWASLINDFNRQYLNPYVNFHRPCLFPEIIIDSKGKQRKRYPYDSLMTLSLLKIQSCHVRIAKSAAAFKPLRAAIYTNGLTSGLAGPASCNGLWQCGQFLAVVDKRCIAARIIISAAS